MLANVVCVIEGLESRNDSQDRKGLLAKRDELVKKEVVKQLLKKRRLGAFVQKRMLSRVRSMNRYSPDTPYSKHQ